METVTVTLVAIVALSSPGSPRPGIAGAYSKQNHLATETK